MIISASDISDNGSKTTHWYVHFKKTRIFARYITSRPPVTSKLNACNLNALWILYYAVIRLFSSFLSCTLFMQIYLFLSAFDIHDQNKLLSFLFLGTSFLCDYTNKHYLHPWYHRHLYTLISCPWKLKKMTKTAF